MNQTGKKFKKIVIVEPAFVEGEDLTRLQSYCDELVVYEDDFHGEAEATQRIGDADCIIVSYKSVIPASVIQADPNLKLIVMACSFYGHEFAKVDTRYAEEHGIPFTYLSSYGDNGVVEFTVAKVVDLLQGFSGQQWRPEPHDLTAVKVGILGLGDLGYTIAKTFMALGSDVYYYSRTRKPDKECDQLHYLELDDLLQTVDVLSINLNRDVCLIGGDKLERFGNGKIIVNSAIGYCYEKESLEKWLQADPGNFYIGDQASTNADLQEIAPNYDNLIYVNHATGQTAECFRRATELILGHIDHYLSTH